MRAAAALFPYGIEILVPVDKIAYSLLDWRTRSVTYVSSKVFRIRPGVGDITRLHWQHAHCGFPADAIFNDGDVAHELDGLLVADVVEPIRGTAGAGVRMRSVPFFIGPCHVIHRPDHALDDIVHVREIPAMLAVVEHVYRLALDNVPGKHEQRHIRPS